jgi:hypothetical protein
MSRAYLGHTTALLHDRRHHLDGQTQAGCMQTAAAATRVGGAAAVAVAAAWLTWVC